MTNAFVETCRTCRSRILTDYKCFPLCCTIREVCDIKWLGLRASHVQDRAWLGQGEPLSDRDRGLLSRLLRRSSVRERQEYVRELESMADMGKYELQGLYSHRSGVGYLASTFIPTALVRRDYL